MEQLRKLLNSKRIVVSDYLIKIALDNDLSLTEFLVLCYFDNSYTNVFEIERVSNTLGLDNNKTMEAFNGLMIKGLVSLETTKDVENRLNEIVKLDGVYDSIIENNSMLVNNETKEDIFKVFERELGRTMSSMELEIINGWLSSGTPEEIILGALKEAVYNNVRSFRYIDRIIYNWTEKGLKTMDEVSAYMKNNRKDKSKDKVISKKEQEILDYDWLDD